MYSYNTHYHFEYWIVTHRIKLQTINIYFKYFYPVHSTFLWSLMFSYVLRHTLCHPGGFMSPRHTYTHKLSHIVLFLSPSDRFRYSVLTNPGSACQGCHVPRDSGGRGSGYACSVRSFTAEQRSTTCWAFPVVKDSHCPPDKLPGWCWASDQGTARAHKTSCWWGSGIPLSHWNTQDLLTELLYTSSIVHSYFLQSLGCGEQSSHDSQPAHSKRGQSPGAGAVSGYGERCSACHDNSSWHGDSSLCSQCAP